MSAPTTAARSAPPSARRVGVRIRGTVQGVGFRPYVFRLAEQLGLGGWVLNDEQGVLCEVEGPVDAVERFLARLPAEAPPLASIESVRSRAATPVGERGFRIRASEGRSEPEALVCADAATCSECLAELADPADRRYRYPFTNCTNCGPRFSIVRGVPYDRPLTTMAGFAMCELCRAEYEDPRDRRFHAQPNACPECGPQARLVDRDGRRIAPAGADRDPIETAARLLRAGAILAVKGIGGYHLACLAGDGRAVAALRARKQRDDKPFALMARDLEAADELVELTAAERALLTGRERPIVIARRRPGAPAASGVAPGSRDLGVMLPYTPLHHLLAADVGEALVLTSGNLSDEPIAYRDDEALARLSGIADAFLVHDRSIHMRTDDSVVRSLDRALRREPLVIRRSRGYVPDGVGLPLSAERPILGCGAELKAAFCVAKGRRAWVGHHIGDLKTWETLRSYREGIEHFERLFGVDPELIAHDRHPDYLATRYALERAEADAVAVQHHHAHLAACLAEHGVTEPAVGAIFDGAGYGDDGTVWGGEVLVGDLAGFERVGALFEVRLPGGDAAAREPWRMAAAWLAAAFEDDVPAIPPALRDVVGADEWEAVLAIARGGANSPPTTSAGRLFDAVAAICGVRARTTYEGQAATELEGIASPRERGAYPMSLASRDGAFSALDARETIRALVADLAGGAGVERAAARFHNGLAGAAARACARGAELRGVGRAVLSGGVFQNRMLVERTAAALRRTGLEVLIPRRLPPNDGGIAYGQVVVAAARPEAMR